MKEQKLRKFKLINREVYSNANSYNEAMLEDHFVGDIVEGCIDEEGYLMVRGYCIAGLSEFKFFEEISEEVQT